RVRRLFGRRAPCSCGNTGSFRPLLAPTLRERSVIRDGWAKNHAFHVFKNRELTGSLFALIRERLTRNREFSGRSGIGRIVGESCAVRMGCMRKPPPERPLC